MPNYMHMDIASIMHIIKKKDDEIVNQIQSRQEALTKVVKAVTRDNNKYYHDLAGSLADVELRCDTVKSHVEDFMKDRSQGRKFERKLKKILKVMEAEEQETETNASQPKTKNVFKLLVAKQPITATNASPPNTKSTVKPIEAKLQITDSNVSPPNTKKTVKPLEANQQIPETNALPPNTTNTGKLLGTKQQITESNVTLPNTTNAVKALEANQQITETNASSPNPKNTLKPLEAKQQISDSNASSTNTKTTVKPLEAKQQVTETNAPPPNTTNVVKPLEATQQITDSNASSPNTNNTVKPLEANQQITETKAAPPKSKNSGTYTHFEMRVIYVKAQYKLELLNTLVENAVEKVISPALETIISKMKHMLQMTPTIILIIEKREQELADVVSRVEIAQNRDLYHIGAHHAHVHNLVDNLQRSVYDKTVPNLSGFQLQNLPIGRPAERPNIIEPLTTPAERRASAKNIEMRLERINNFCNDYLDKETYNFMNMLWTQALEGAGTYLSDGVFFPDIIDGTAEGQPGAIGPQAGQTVNPQAGENLQAADSSGSVLN